MFWIYSGTAKSIINIKIVDLDKNPSTNPVTDDRNDTFSYVPIPGREEKTNVYGVLGGRNIGYGIVPVSYTHLDVYKRQL